MTGEPLCVAPGGDCLCGRGPGPAVGTLTHTSGRMHFRAFHDGPASWHHEHSADWVCLDCVADTAAALDANWRRHLAPLKPALAEMFSERLAG